MTKNKNKIVVNNISKIYKMYNSPMDRLKEAFSIHDIKYHTVFRALKNISFTVKEGEILGILGRNGAGKSTLLKVITGILEPSEGKVEVEGKISSLLELGTGFNMEYTGIENIYFYGTLMGLSKAEMDEKLDEIVHFAEIGDYVYQPVKTYSSGMFARLAFSCAINVKPEVLIVDEILSVGDMRFQAKCFNKFEEFKKDNITILYVGHDIGMMRTFCDRVMWINNGEMVDIGDPTFICAKYTEFMYLEDISEFTSYKKLAEPDESKEQLEIQTDSPQEEVKYNMEQKFEESMFPNCIAHWGTKVGLINEVRLTNTKGEELGHFYSDEEMIIKIKFSLKPEEIDLKYFSLAFSIKNKEGTDLIVKSTLDEELYFIEKEGEYAATFRLVSRLKKGEYYLVVALENRENASITYYEYIEGVKYFKVYSDKKIFGIVDLEMDITLE